MNSKTPGRARSVVISFTVLILLHLLSPLRAAAQDAVISNPIATPIPTTLIAPLPVATGIVAVAESIVLERGPNYKIIQTATRGTYHELADGLCYLQDDGTYADSQDLIELVDGGSGGAISRKGPIKVSFAPNINTATGSVDLLTPDNKRLVSKVLGLAFADSASGQSVMIASVKDSFGKLTSSNLLVL